MTAQVLVAGVGNVFRADDGFGVEVAKRLAGSGVLPDGVELADIGIRGMHLAYQLLDGYRVLVLVDAARRGAPPGTIHVLEHDLAAPTGPAAMDAHDMSPDTVLALLGELARGLGVPQQVDRVLVVGCEPARMDDHMGLSPPVAAAVDEAVRTVVDLLDDLLGKGDGYDHSVGVRSNSGSSSSSGAAVAT